MKNALALLITASVFGLVLFGVYSAGTTQGYDDGFAEGIAFQTDRMLRPPSPRSLSLRPAADVRPPTVDAERVLRGLAQTSAAAPERADGPSAAFRESVDLLHAELIEATADLYALTDPQRAAMRAAYRVRADSVASVYFDRLTSSRGMRPEMGLAAPAAPLVLPVASDLSPVLFDHACLLLSTLIGVATPNTPLPLAVSGFCQLVRSHVVNPLSLQLRETGLFMDVKTASTRMMAYTRTSVAEMATEEDRVSFRLSTDYARSVGQIFSDSNLYSNWTATLSEALADIDVLQRNAWVTELAQKAIDVASETVNEAMSARLTVDVDATVKAGFDLRSPDYALDVDRASRTLIVQLPAPDVLSTDVSVRVVGAKDGLLIRIDSTRYNDTYRSVRQQVRDTSLARGILACAAQRAQATMETLFRPTLDAAGSRYRVAVRFAGDAVDPAMLRTTAAPACARDIPAAAPSVQTTALPG